MVGRCRSRSRKESGLARATKDSYVQGGFPGVCAGLPDHDRDAVFLRLVAHSRTPVLSAPCNHRQSSGGADPATIRCHLAEPPGLRGRATTASRASHPSDANKAISRSEADVSIPPPSSASSLPFSLPFPYPFVFVSARMEEAAWLIFRPQKFLPDPGYSVRPDPGD